MVSTHLKNISQIGSLHPNVPRNVENSSGQKKLDSLSTPKKKHMDHSSSRGENKTYFYSQHCSNPISSSSSQNAGPRARWVDFREKKHHSNPSIPANQNMLQNFKMLLLKVYISSIRVGSLIRGLRFRNLHPG